MKAARLYGAKDMRVVDIPEPASPGPGDILIKVKAVGICGSDLHMYENGRIGYTEQSDVFTPGHEFMGEVTAVGEGALDGHFEPLKVGQRVAVDPCTPCYECEMCEQGHPNLCLNHTFYGLFPEDGALQECMIVHGRNCFPIPDSVSDGGGTLLETLGVAIHTIDLAKLKVAKSVAIIGCGPVGLLILALAKKAGAYPIYAFDKFDWRLEKARQWGADEVYNVDQVDGVQALMDATNGRGCDTVIEAAWADHSIQMAAEMAAYGGRLVLVGIPGDDKLHMQHAVARRKGLTIMMCRRMKHTYPRAIALATTGMVHIEELISHHFSLEETPEAFAKNFRYDEGVHKIIIDV